MGKIRLRINRDIARRFQAVAMYLDIPLEQLIGKAIERWIANPYQAEPPKRMMLATFPVENGLLERFKGVCDQRYLALRDAFEGLLRDFLASEGGLEAPAPKSEVLKSVETPTTTSSGSPNSEMPLEGVHIRQAGFVHCYQCAHDWKPQARSGGRPSYCPKCHKREWEDAWKCRECSSWFPQSARRGQYCVKHQREDGDASRAEPVSASAACEPFTCDCGKMTTDPTWTPFCSQECHDKWHTENDE